MCNLMYKIIYKSDSTFENNSVFILNKYTPTWLGKQKCYKEILNLILIRMFILYYRPWLTHRYW